MSNSTAVQQQDNNTSTHVKPTYKSKNIYAEVTQLIIDKMKEGHLVWNQGFQRVQAKNWMSKTTYSGINALILNYVYGYEPCPFYATFKQVQSMKGTIKKGVKGKMIVFYSPFYVQQGQKSINHNTYQNLSKDEQSKWIKKATLRHFYVFNMLDTENCGGFDYDFWKGKTTEQTETPELKMMQNYQTVLDGYSDKPVMKDHRNKNAYAPIKDCVYLVSSNRWDNLHEYIGTACHELIHSTGHNTRLNRLNLMENIQFGSKGYALEELIAEIGAAFLCHHIGTLPKTIENTAAYLQSWIQILENDERLIFTASAQAQKAVNWILKK